MGCCGKLAHGAVGLTKAALRIDRASDETIAARRDACRVCAHMGRRRRKDGALGLTTLSRCAKCDCFIGPKTTLATETCPLGLWLK